MDWRTKEDFDDEYYDAEDDEWYLEDEELPEVEAESGQPGTLRFLQAPLVSVVKNHLVDYPTPVNVSYFWGFGSAAGRFLALQLVTGIFLARHYTAHVDLAFLSVEHIRRDVNHGWLLRYLHANGASFFFLAVYVHIFRGLYYGSYARPRALVWRVGIVIFILRRATAFRGYVLPWGQRSFWAATVIVNLFSAVPVVGSSIVEWLYGGFSVGNATLNRFYSFHYLLPFVITAAVFVHLAALHFHGSNNPLGISRYVDKIAFYPYLWVKDLFGWVLFFGALFAFVFFAPNRLGHTDNYIEANPRVTPAHIVPEWYFLPFYAILRSIPHKLGGVVARFGALIVLLILPFLTVADVRSSIFRSFYRKRFWLLVLDWFILGWIGNNNPEYPYYEIGQTATVFYFVWRFLFVPAIGFLENYLNSRLLEEEDEFIEE